MDEIFKNDWPIRVRNGFHDKVKKLYTEEETDKLTAEDIYNMMQDPDSGGFEFKHGKCCVFEKRISTPEQMQYREWFEAFHEDQFQKYKKHIEETGFLFHNISVEEYIKNCMKIPACVKNLRDACGLIFEWAFQLEEERIRYEVLRKFVSDVEHRRITDIAKEAKEAWVKADALKSAYCSVRRHIVHQYPDDLYEEVVARGKRAT